MRTHIAVGLLAVGLSACGAEGVDSSDAVQVGTGGPLAETGPELTIGSSGGEVAELNRYLTEYGYFPNEKLTSFDPRWRAPIARAPAHSDLFDDSTLTGLQLLQRNVGLPATGIVDSDTRTFLRTPRCGNPDNVQVSDPSDKFGLQIGNWNGLVTLKWRLANAPPASAGFSIEEARAIINSVLRDWERYSRHVFLEVGPASGEAIVMAFANTFSPSCPAGNQPVCGIACTSPPQPGGTTCSFYRTDFTWNRTSFKTAVLHELGHAFGLGHSGYPSAAMFPAATATVTVPDDKEAAIVHSVHWGLLDEDGDEDLAVVGRSTPDLYVLANPRIGNDLTLWKLDHAAGWQNMSTTIGGKRVGASTGQVWMVQDDGDVYRFNGSWSKISGECGTDITVGTDNSVWMLGCSAADAEGNHSIYRWNGADFIKDSATGAKAMRISVGRRLDTNQVVPWIVRDTAGDNIAGAGAVYRRDGNNTNSGTHWDSLPQLTVDPQFQAKDISGNDAGYTWIVSNGGGRLMVYDEQPASAGGIPPAQKIDAWLGATFGGAASGAGVFIATSDWGVPYTANNVNQVWVAD